MADLQFTAEEMANLLATTIDYHMTGKVYDQSMYQKHLLKDLEATSQPFPGGVALLTWPAQLENGDDGEEPIGLGSKLTFSNPAFVREASAKWYERHTGLTVTFTELKKMGIIVTNSTMGTASRESANSAAIRLVHGLQNKISTRIKARAEKRSKMFWGDGTANAGDVPGVRYWVQDVPSTPLIVGGLDQGALPLWRNRAQLGIVANSSNASGLPLISVMQTEARQLARYGGRPNKRYAGSDFLNQLETELRARGDFTSSGWAKQPGQRLDVSMDDVYFNGISFQYEPELDNIGRAKYCYVLQIGEGGLMLRHLDGDRDRKHEPARPHDEFAIYQSITWTGGMIAVQRNNQGVYSIA